MIPNAEAVVAHLDRLIAENARLRSERDRARNIAVALEAELAGPPRNARDRWHSIEIDEYANAMFRCEAPEGSPCRCLPACQFGSGPCIDCEGGHAGDCPGDLTPLDTGECVIEPWINNYDECGRGLVRIAVTTEWTGDTWAWSQVGAS